MGVSTHWYAALSQGSARSRVQQTSSKSFQTRHASFQTSSLSSECKYVSLSLHFEFFTYRHKVQSVREVRMAKQCGEEMETVGKRENERRIKDGGERVCIKKKHYKSMDSMF